MCYKLHSYQQEALNFLLSHDHASLFLDPGLGKTLITLEAIKQLKPQKTLLIAPLRVCQYTWANEIKKFNFGFSYSFIHGKNKDFSADIIAVNPEGLDRVLGKAKFDCLVIDELTKFKNVSSKRFKLLRKYKFKYAFGLTGSPCANNLVDLFGQSLIIDGGVALGTRLGCFVNQYFNVYFNGKYKVITPRPDTKDLIIARLKNVMSLQVKDMLGELRTNKIFIELDKKTKAIYDEAIQELVLLDTPLINKTSAIAKVRQILAGNVYLDGEVAKINTQKLEVLKELIEELQGQQLLIGYQFRHEMELFKANLDYNDLSDPKTIDKWNAGDIQLLFGHPQSMGHGLNLQGSNCSHVCFTSLPYDYELYEQFIRRVYRQGNTSSLVMVHHILANSTVDVKISELLEKKEQNQQEFLQKVFTRF